MAGSDSVGETEVQTVAEALSAEVAAQGCRIAQMSGFHNQRLWKHEVWCYSVPKRPSITSLSGTPAASFLLVSRA